MMSPTVATATFSIKSATSQTSRPASLYKASTSL